MLADRQTLPLGCEAFYQPQLLSSGESSRLFTTIADNYDIDNRVIRLDNGDEIHTETGACMFADTELLGYDRLPAVWGPRYAWPDQLRNIKSDIEKATGHIFHVARCIFYRDGSEGVDFHRDLAAYGDTNAIASLSLGAERDFLFRGIDEADESLRLTLADGSLLFMGDGCQELYEHSLPVDPTCTASRINLTFRKYGFG